MADLFAQQGIDLGMPGFASTHPSAAPAPIEAPHIDLPPAAQGPAAIDDAAPAVSISDSQNTTASPRIDDLAAQNANGDLDISPAKDGAAGGSAPTATADAPQPAQEAGGRDLFTEQGIEPPTVTSSNANAFNDGVFLGGALPKAATPPTSTDYGYGNRADGSMKGKGFLGELKRPDGGVSTEISVGIEVNGKEMEVPTLVPTLTKDEVNYLLAGNEPTPAIIKKASDHAMTRMDQGLNPFADNAQPSSKSAGLVMGNASVNEDIAYARQYGKDDYADLLKVAQARFGDDKVKQWMNNPIGFIEGFNKLNTSQVVPLGGIKAGYDALEIRHIAEKSKNGEPLSASETQELNDFVDKQLEFKIRGFSWSGNTAYIGSQIPAFALEFAASDGVGKMAQVAARKAVEDLAVHSALSSAAAVTARIATTTALMPGQYVPKYGERRLNDSMAVTDKGAVIFKDSTESPAKSALLAFGHTAADVAGQIAAPVVGKYVVDPITKAVRTPIVAALNQLPAVTKDALYQAYKVIQPNAQVSKVFTAMGWKGMIEQLGANRVSQILNSSLDFASDKEMTTDQYLDALVPSKDQLMVEGGLVSIAGGVHASANVAFNLMKAKGIEPKVASDTVENMSATERDNYVHQNLPTPESHYPDVRENGELSPVERASVVQQYDTHLDSLRKEVPTKPLEAKPPAGVHYSDLDPSTPAFEEAKKIEAEYGFDLQPRPKAAENANVKPSAESLAAAQVAEQAGVDPRTATGEQLYNAVGPDPEVKLTAARMGIEVSPQDALDIREQMNEQGIDAPTAVKQFTEANGDAHADMPMPRQLRDAVSYDGDVARNQTQAAEKVGPPPIIDEESTYNYLNRALFNRFAPAEEPYMNAVKAGMQPKKMDNTPLLISLNHQTPELVRSFLMVNTFKWGAEGEIINTGKSLKAILDDFDNYFLIGEPIREIRRQDFNAFLKARHFLSLEKTAPHVLVTDQQKFESTRDLKRLTNKYGQDLRFFETFGNEFVDFRNRARDLLVGTLLTPAQRAAEKEMFPYSVPLKREMDKKVYEAALQRGDYSSLTPGPLNKHLKGSALPVKDILLETLKDTARTIDFVQHNRVNLSILHLKDFAPESVQQTELPIVKKGTAEFLQAFDPKLREKLQQAIEFLGGTVSRQETIASAHKGVTLGSYSSAESLVRLRIGTTEGTMAHETGHLLDDKIGLGKRMLADKDIKAELQKLAEDRLASEHEMVDTEEGIRFKEEKQKAGKTYTDYIKNDHEVIANFFDAYVNSPDQLKATAPKALAEFEKVIDENSQLAFIRDLHPSTSRSMEKIKKDVYGHGDLPPQTFGAWENGEKKYVKVAKPMFEALSSMRPSQVSNASRFFSATVRLLSGANILRAGATSTPEFAMRNVVRDTSEATVQSGVGYGPSYIPKSLFGMLKKTPEFREFEQAGGKFASFMALDDGNIEKSFEDILNPKSNFRKLISHPIEAYEKIPKASETLTRFGVYRAGIERGYSPVEAADFALNATLNFPRGGFAAKAANKYMPFLNVGFLATERLVKSMRADPKTMLLRGVTYLTAPALLVSGYYLYGADEDTRNEWLELPVDQIAQGRVFFKYNGEWRYIPTPYALGYMFSGVPMMALRAAHMNNPDDGRSLWTHMMKGMVGAVSPINDWSAVIPPTLKVMLEDITNYDMFRDRNIYSKFKEGDNVQQRDKSTPYDTETAKAIGNVFNVSPAIIDHSIFGLFGGVGGYALKASDAGINAARRADGQQVPEKPDVPAFKPVTGAFTVRRPEAQRSNSYQGFQQHFLDVQGIDSHLKGMPAGEDQAKYRIENSVQLAQLPQLKSAQKQMAEVNKRISAIQVNVNMDAKEKTEHINELEKQITRIARNSNLQYNTAIKSAGN